MNVSGGAARPQKSRDNAIRMSAKDKGRMSDNEETVQLSRSATVADTTPRVGASNLMPDHLYDFDSIML
jgi:hypothetical protein